MANQKGSEEGHEYASAYLARLSRVKPEDRTYRQVADDTAVAYDELSPTQKRDAWAQLKTG